MNEEKTPVEESVNLVEIIISDDQKQCFIKLSRNEEGTTTFSKDQLHEILKENKIQFGIMESMITKLAERPIFNIKVKVAEGNEPIDGEDGFVNYLVKRDADYKPEFADEDRIDYKSLSYFQIVKKNQVLCEITKEKEGIDGKNIFGEKIPAIPGKKPNVPTGKNTSLNEAETKLLATCDGIVKFIGNTIHINEMLHITTNVDLSTGNIDFSGDVTIDGDVCRGFSVKTGGNLIVKGVVEGSKVEAAGNVLISKGIYGGSGNEIKVGKDLRCNFIENAVLQVGGDITVDYIIDGKIICKGNITLSGTKEIIFGGEIQLTGNLIVRELGNDREYPTIIKILGEEIIDSAAIEKLDKKTEELKMQLEAAYEKEVQINELLLLQEKKDILNRNQDNTAMKQIGSLKKAIDKQVLTLKYELNDIQEKIRKIENNPYINYYGSVSVKRKLHRGTRIYFGEMLFHYELDTLERCRIYWDEDKIINGVM